MLLGGGVGHGFRCAGGVPSSVRPLLTIGLRFAKFFSVALFRTPVSFGFFSNKQLFAAPPFIALDSCGGRNRYGNPRVCCGGCGRTETHHIRAARVRQAVKERASGTLLPSAGAMPCRTGVMVCFMIHLFVFVPSSRLADKLVPTTV